MLFYSAPLMGSHFFQQARSFAGIANDMGNSDVVFAVHSSANDRNNVVKRNLARMNTTTTDVTIMPIAFKNMLVTDLFDGCVFLAYLIASCVLHAFEGMGLTISSLTSGNFFLVSFISLSALSVLLLGDSWPTAFVVLASLFFVGNSLDVRTFFAIDGQSIMSAFAFSKLLKGFFSIAHRTQLGSSRRLEVQARALKFVFF